MTETFLASSTGYWLLATDFSPLPLAAGFVTPAFVAAGAGLIAIPIIIHILNRRRFKTVTWAAMDFLLRALKKNRRRLRFEQWLLLATRCLLIFLVGMALARPLGCQNQTIASLGGNTGLSVFIVDNSYSAAYEVNHPDGKTHLERSKKLAKGLIDRLNRGGESVAIITAARTTRPGETPATQPGSGTQLPPLARDAVVFRPGYDLDAAKDAIDRIEQTWSGTDMANALQLAVQVGREQSSQPNKRLFILTDSTRSAWTGPHADAIRQAGEELAKVFKEQVFLHDLTGGQAQWNHAAIALNTTDNLVTSRFGTTFQAHVKGYGAGPESVLQWRLNDRIVEGEGAGRTIKLDPDTPPQNLARSSLPGGPQLVTVALNSDNDHLRIDNTRHRVVDVASELKVLIVEGQRGLRAFESSGFFLREALAPGREPSTAGTPGSGATNSYAAPEVISELELTNKLPTLGEYSAVILAGVGDLSEGEADRIRQYVEYGGTLMVFLGEPVSDANYNAVLLPRRLIPGPLVKRVSSTGATGQEPYSFEFNPAGVLHPYLEAFRNWENSGLNTTRVFTYWQVDVPTDPSIRILNYLPGKNAPTAAPDAKPDPAFTVHGLGQGRVVFCSTSANQEWNSFPNKQNYPALIHELLGHSVRTAGRWLNLTVGEPLVLPPAIRLPAAPVLADPSGKPVVVSVVTGPVGETTYRTDPLTRPGVYALTMVGRNYPVAVNVPDDEADVRTLNEAALRDALGGITLNVRGADLPSEAAAGDTTNDWGWALMVMVLALLGVECFMAMRFGHYRRTSEVVRQ